VINPRQIFVPDSTQHSQETDIHGNCGIQNKNPSKRTATGIVHGLMIPKLIFVVHLTTLSAS